MAETLVETIDTQGIDTAVRQYHNLKSTQPDEYDFGESELNTLGYHYLGEGDIASAITIFALNVEAYPDASNAYDSLGEAYMAAGNHELAIANYTRSVELDPGNENGKAMLARLGVELEDEVGEEVIVPIAVLETYVGEYELRGDLVVVITLEDGQLMGQATGQGKYELVPVSQTQFRIESVELRVTFVLDEEGTVSGFNLYQGGETLFAERMR